MENELRTGIHSPHNHIGIKYTQDGSIDYDSMLCEGMTDINKKAATSNKGKSSIISLEKCIEFTNKFRESKNKGNAKAQKPKKVEETLDIIDDLKEQEEKENNDDEQEKPIIITKSIDTCISKSLEEIQQYPELKSDIITSVADINANYDNLSGSQRINVYDVGNRWGKTDVKMYGITYTGAKVHNHKVINFGSIDDYDIDTLPINAIRGKGQEITYLTQIRKINKNKSIISRRFASNVLAYWSNIVGIRYTTHGNSGDINGIELWGREVDGFDNRVINGEDIIGMIKDIILIIRNASISNASLQLKTIFKYIKDNSDGFTDKDILSAMKKRIYWDFQIGRFSWAYPKMNIEYLTGLQELLIPSQYLLDICVPLIYDRYRYPIRCTDTKLRPMTEEQHEKNIDSYDITQYLWERE